MNSTWERYSDAELFNLLTEEKSRSDKAFAELYARLGPRVYAYCRRILGNDENARDVFQETFIKFYQAAFQEREMTNIPAFVLRIARNLCVNKAKKEPAHISFEDYMAVAESEEDEKEEMLKLVRTALELLPDDFKELFILREYNGLSYQDISEVTGISLANVKVKIFRAKQKIREILAPYMKEFQSLDKN